MVSLTDEVAMDCEMVGVSQGTKSALGRVTLVHIAFPTFVFFFFKYHEAKFSVCFSSERLNKELMSFHYRFLFIHILRCISVSSST